MIKQSWVRQLRAAYPTVNIIEFVHVYDAHRDDELQLLTELERLEEQAKARATIIAALDRQAMRRIEDNMPHRKLRLMVPASVDEEHAAAILAYGFMRLSQTIAYTGSRVLYEGHVRVNVRNKLGDAYSDRLYDGALDQLIRSGVVHRTGKRSTAALSLNLRETDSSVDLLGQHTIRMAKQVLHQKSA